MSQTDEIKTRGKRGRPRKPDALVQISVRVHPAHLEWLRSQPGGVGRAIGALVENQKKFSA